MTHDVFISYSTHDKPVADAVCGALEAAGIRCWIAPRDVLAGMEYAEAIVEAIGRSRSMVLVYSANANASPHVRREVEGASNKGVPIVPLRVHDVRPGGAMEYFLQSTHWLDAITPPLEGHLPRLTDTVERLLARSERLRPAAAPPTVPEAPAGQNAPQWQLEQGAAGIRKGDLDAAIAAYTKAIELDPDARAAFQGRAEAYAMKGEADFAIADFSDSLRRGPVACLFGRAKAYLARGDFERALEDLNELTESEPNFAAAFFTRVNARVRFGSENWAAIIGDCTKVMRLNPRLVLAYVYRAEALVRVGVPDGGGYAYVPPGASAFADCGQAIRLDPANATPYRIRGDAYLFKGQYDRALTELNTALTLKPGYADAYFSLGRLFAAQGEADRAIAHLTEAIRLNPSHRRAYLARGQAYRRKGQYDSAIADLSENQRLRAQPATEQEDKEVYAERGMAYAAKGDDDKAMADLGRGTYHNSSPLNAEPALAFGQVLARKGSWEKAIEEYRFVIGCYDSQEYVKPRALALYYRSLAYAGNNEPEESAKDHDLALELDPSLADRPTEESLRTQVAKQLQEKKAAEERQKNEREEAIAGLAASIPDPYKPEPGDIWSDVAAKASILRKAGNIGAAVAALKACEIILGNGNWRAIQYLRIALALTPQLTGLGVDGGLFVYEPESKSFFSGRDEYVLTRYNGRTLLEQADLAKALNEAIPGEPVLIECLFKAYGQESFERRTFTLRDGRLRATFIPL